MNFFERILDFLDGQMATPTAYGWFHLMMLSIMIALAIFMVVKFRNADDKTNRKILLTFSIIMILFEIYKQLNFSYNGSTDVWDYQWYAFPFQFCSVPMYVMLLAGLLHKGKVQNALFAFLGTYTLFAGLAVMLYPGDVFIGTIGINIQTMIHHGLMLVIGVYMLASGRAKLEHKTILSASLVFAIIVAMALGMDYVMYSTGIVGSETFNMFFISPYFGNHLPILSMIRADYPYLVFLAAYILGFALVAYIMLLLGMLVRLISRRINNCIKNKGCKTA
ncbi:MAG: YwaF family protein [Spirochaetales bacterium]